MGLGGYITLYNDTDYDMRKDSSGSYQMVFKSPAVIPAHQSVTFYVEWGQGGSVSDDDSAYTNYVIQDGTGRVIAIEAWARPQKHFQMVFKSYSQPGSPVGKVVNIGWQHDGTVGFHVTQPQPPKPDPCFLEGSLILTREGYKPVETLEPGQNVVVLGERGHEFREIVFVGHNHCTVEQSDTLGPDEARWPVCVRAHAFGPMKPRRDLRMTSEHCVLVKDSLVPIRMLVNGESIFYDLDMPTYRYIHFATRDHAIVIAENLYTESYLPGENVIEFSEVTVQGSVGRSDLPRTPARPIRTEREFVEPVYRDLAMRARAGEGAVPHEPDVTTDPDLYLALPCGTRIVPDVLCENEAIFTLSHDVERVFIRSRADRPSDAIGAYVDDRRMLGILVGGLTLSDLKGDRTVDLDFQDPSLRGWHTPEAVPMRWTKGSAEVIIPNGFSTADKRVSLRVLHNEPYRI